MTTNQELTPQAAAATVEAAAAIPLQPLQFMPVEDLTTFRAEVAITDGDFVYHFFPTEEVRALPDAGRYWSETFPVALEKTAKEYFKADESRLKAAYTEEQVSWWMRAFGFGMVLNPHKLALEFCDALDKELDLALGVPSNSK